MSSVVVRLVDRDSDPVRGRRVTLWWKGFMVPEGGSDEYTDSDGEATFDYSTDNWPGDQLAISVEGREIKGYHSYPESFYEFTV